MVILKFIGRCIKRVIQFLALMALASTFMFLAIVKGVGLL